MAPFHQHALSATQIAEIVAMAEKKSARAKAEGVREAWIVVAEFWRWMGSGDELHVPCDKPER